MDANSSNTSSGYLTPVPFKCTLQHLYSARPAVSIGICFRMRSRTGSLRNCLCEMTGVRAYRRSRAIAIGSGRRRSRPMVDSWHRRPTITPSSSGIRLPAPAHRRSRAIAVRSTRRHSRPMVDSWHRRPTMTPSSSGIRLPAPAYRRSRAIHGRLLLAEHFTIYHSILQVPISIQTLVQSIWVHRFSRKQGCQTLSKACVTRATVLAQTGTGSQEAQRTGCGYPQSTGQDALQSHSRQ
jgi:hypothetical protein